MAVVQEQINDLWHTYSDAGKKIFGGNPQDYYDEAYDPEQREYVESDIPVSVEEDNDNDEYYAEAGRILLGEGGAE